MPLALFDLDGTLVDQAGAARSWARRFAKAWSRGEQNAGDIAAALTQRRPKGEVFSLIIQRFGLPVTPDVVWSDYRAQMPGLVRCTDADRSALQDLRDAG